MYRYAIQGCREDVPPLMAPAVLRYYEQLGGMVRMSHDKIPALRMQHFTNNNNTTDIGLHQEVVGCINTFV